MPTTVCAYVLVFDCFIFEECVSGHFYNFENEFMENTTT
jgi:hypothetical protein